MQGSWGAAGRRRHTRASPDRRKGVASLLPRHGLRRRVTSDVRASRGLVPAPGSRKGRHWARGGTTPQRAGWKRGVRTQVRGRLPRGPAPASTVRRWPGSVPPFTNHSKRTRGLGPASLFLFSQSFTARSPWQLHNKKEPPETTNVFNEFRSQNTGVGQAGGR